MGRRKFKPRPGQVDYTNARFAPVINCVVRHRGKILLVERSRTLNFYPGYWNGISGFLDDRRSLEEKVKDELREELGISQRHVRKITLGKIFHQEAPRYGKTWIVHPILVDVTTNKVKLDWEAERFQWVTPREAERLRLLPGCNRVLQTLSSWIRA